MLHVTGSFTADNKVYDGGTSASVLTRSPGVVINGDDIHLIGGTATFDTRNVGTGKTVTLSGASLSGGDAGNYVLDSVATTTANISKRTLDISAVTDSKTYDGTANSSATPTYTGLQTGDSLSGLVESYDSKNAGSRTLSVNAGYTLSDGTGAVRAEFKDKHGDPFTVDFFLAPGPYGSVAKVKTARLR